MILVVVGNCEGGGCGLVSFSFIFLFFFFFAMGFDFGMWIGCCGGGWF